MTFPVNPAADGITPIAILLELPSRAALRRALAAADIGDELDDDDDPEHFLDALSQVDLRQTAAQARYAAPQTVHYFQVSGLTDVSPPELDDLTNSEGFGGQVHAVEELHERVYVVCSVPEGGTQAQLSVSEDSRARTVATFDPGTDLLVVRAADVDLAAGTVQALKDHPDLADSSRVSFRNDGFRSRFEDAAVVAYEQLSLAATADTARTERIEVTGTESGESGRADVREDDVAHDLLASGDTQRAKAVVRLDFESNSTLPPEPRVQIDFSDSAIAFRQWVPEETFIRLDKAVRDAI